MDNFAFVYKADAMLRLWSGGQSLAVTLTALSLTGGGGGSKRWTFSETADNRDFTVCIIRCVYRAELILGR